jgi:predicted NAD/FAD-binding protein
MAPLSIAVIGSGISGLSAAWLLSKSQNVTLYEADSRLGGHSNTVSVRTPEGGVPVDTGFIVFNERNYPNLTALLAHLDVESAQSSMSFAVSIAGGKMEYCGRHLNGLFGQRRNLIRVEHWQLVGDILRFFRQARRQLDSCSDDISIEEFLKRFGYSKAFVQDHILPISAAIWSTPTRGMLDFPARTFIEFFDNHSLLQVTRPPWRTVRGGSHEYVRKLVAQSGFETVTGSQIRDVRRSPEGVVIAFADGSSRRFDHVIMACHADQALALLGAPSAEEHRLLSSFRYTKNRAVLHTDPRFMPRRKHLWSAWNYLRGSDGEENLSLTYWMNRLQPLATKTNIFVTLNPHQGFADGTVQMEVDYEHPLLDSAAVKAQSQLWRIQGEGGIWFAGSWMGYGFHEDGLQAGLEIAERIGPVNRPWSVATQRDRIAHNWVYGDRRLDAAE